MSFLKRPTRPGKPTQGALSELRLWDEQYGHPVTRNAYHRDGDYVPDEAERGDGDDGSVLGPQDRPDRKRRKTSESTSTRHITVSCPEPSV
jgi:hypothetical protein